MNAMDPTTLVWLGPALVFVIALVFSMLRLGGAMLYVPVFKWLELPLKTVAIPLGLLLNGATSLSAFLRYWREGLVDFRDALPAPMLTARACLRVVGEKHVCISWSGYER